jgi:hypothetical protein
LRNVQKTRAGTIMAGMRENPSSMPPAILECKVWYRAVAHDMSQRRDCIWLLYVAVN